jgi:hypothetical protein
VAAAAARVGAEGVEDPICRAVGHPWRAGRARGLAGVLGWPVLRGRKKGEGGKERCQVGPTGQKEGRRCGLLAWARVAAHLGRGKREKRKGEKWAAGRGSRPRREEGEKGQAGLWLGWLVFSFSFPFSISTPFEAQIYLNSNELLNSNPVHSFQ